MTRLEVRESLTSEQKCWRIGVKKIVQSKNPSFLLGNMQLSRQCRVVWTPESV